MSGTVIRTARQNFTSNTWGWFGFYFYYAGRRAGLSDRSAG
jgi:hypothetical protein